jgi:ATP-dependent DNA helicase RecQ
VLNVETKPGTRTASAPFTTSTLQQEASSRLGYNVTSTMRLAQRLYEEGFITYMRTDSVRTEPEAMKAVRDYVKKKYGKDFAELIARYVEENDIVRPDDLVVKSTGVNSANKLYIIQNIDRKLPLNDIASAKGLDMDALLKEMEMIVYSGTKLNIKYWIDDLLDDEQQEEIFDYYMEAQSDSISNALKEFDGDYDTEELRLMRIKFISEVAN